MLEPTEHTRLRREDAVVNRYFPSNSRAGESRRR
jgi:hypothetical protein